MLLHPKTWFAATLPIIVMMDSALLLPPTVRRVATYCHQEDADKRCFHLYNKRDFSSWLTAYELCLEFGQRLATVPDRRTQVLMERFSTVTLSGPGQPHAWIAGRRTEDNAWRTLDEIQFPGPVSQDKYGNSSCVVYHPLNKAFYMHSCRQDTPYLNMFVCQYLSSRGCLDASALLLQPICYKVLAPTLTSPVRTWNGANQRCQDLYPEGTLAYSYIYPEAEVTDYISQTMIQSGHSDVLVWIGIRRHPWVWVTESSDGEIVEIPFTYTNWWNQEGASVDERCAHLDLSQRSAWADKDCSVLSQYFVCEQEGITSSYDVTTTPQTEDSDQKLTTITYQDVPYTVEVNMSNYGGIANNATNVTANKHGVQEVTAKQEGSVVTTTPAVSSVTSTTTTTTTATTNTPTGPTTTTSHTHTTTTGMSYMQRSTTTTATTHTTTEIPIKLTTRNLITASFGGVDKRTDITTTFTRSTTLSITAATTSLTAASSLAPYTTAASSPPKRTPNSETSQRNSGVQTSTGTITTTEQFTTTLPRVRGSISIAPGNSSVRHQVNNTEANLNRSDTEINLTTSGYVTKTPPGGSGIVSIGVTNDSSAIPGTVTKSTEDVTKTASLITTENIELTFIISVVIICAAVTMLVIGANIWDTKRSKRKKTKDVYFGSDENSSGASNFNSAFAIENGIESGDKSTISHINIGRINTMALKGNSMLLRDHETASLAINPAYSSCSEQDPEENFKCPDVVSRRPNVGGKKEDETRVSGSTASNSLIQSLHYSDVSYGGHLEFKDGRTQKPIYD